MFLESTISEHVTSAPNSTQRRRKGRLPRVVRGAIYSLLWKSRGCGDGEMMGPSGLKLKL